MLDVIFFALKVIVVVLGIGSIVLLFAFLAARAAQKPEIEINPLDEKFKFYRDHLESFGLTKSELKKRKKEHKKEYKKEQEQPSVPRLFVLNFKGDRDASEVSNLKEEINALLQVASSKDEVLVRVESPGGSVQGYGLAAAQLLRIRQKGIPLVVSIDRVAASGGYLMACIANRIIASPFAVVGSIGVVASLPNFHKILKKWDVDYKEYTAGEFKRTVGLLTEITPKAEEKFISQLEEVHQSFKSFVGKYRPSAALETISTGEYWLASNSLSLGLVDELKTSDEYILDKFQDKWSLLSIKYEQKVPFMEKLSHVIAKGLHQSLQKFFEKLENRCYP